MSNSFRKCLSKIPRKHEIKKLQITVILGTAHAHGKVLIHTCEIFNMGNNITYLLTPWSRVLLEKLASLKLVKKFPAFYRTRRFLTALTSARHLSLS